MGMGVLGMPSLRRIGEPNPAFDVSARSLRPACEEMLASPKKLQRPVLLLSGWRSSAPAVNALAGRLCELTSGNSDDFFTVSYPLVGDVSKAVEIAVRAVAARFPGDAGQTAPLDVIGISMGGLVARAAALTPSADAGRPRLDIVRLFTLGTPHRGARLARRFGIDQAARDMRAGSDFLARLDDHLRTEPYELICYARLGDVMVGSTNAAPPGRHPLWVPSALFLSHITIAGDPAIAADIARRLRDEPPIASENGPAPRN